MNITKVALFVAVFLGSFSQPSFASSDDFLTVQVKQAQLHSTPSFLGSVTSTLAYGDKVKFIEEKGAWKMVAIRKVKGWIHTSALTTKTVVLQAGKENVKTGATSGELAIAGKGFNAKVEAEFKSKNRNIDYKQVDKMETFTIKPLQMQTFLKQGEVNVPEEAAP